MRFCPLVYSHSGIAHWESLSPQRRSYCRFPNRSSLLWFCPSESPRVASPIGSRPTSVKIAIAIKAELPSISESPFSVVVLPIGNSHSGIARWESPKNHWNLLLPGRRSLSISQSICCVWFCSCQAGGAIVDFQIDFLFVRLSLWHRPFRVARTTSSSSLVLDGRGRCDAGRRGLLANQPPLGPHLLTARCPGDTSCCRQKSKESSKRLEVTVLSR